MIFVGTQTLLLSETRLAAETAPGWSRCAWSQRPPARPTLRECPLLPRSEAPLF